MKDQVAACCTTESVKTLTAEATKSEIAALGLKAGQPASAEVIALTADVAELKKTRTQERKDRICDRARLEGKVVLLSAESIAALSAEQLEDHVAKLPITVPLEQRTKITLAGADPAPGRAYNDDQAAIARACGNDPDKVYANAKK